MAYGIITYKSDGTTVVLQNSAKSAVFGQSVILQALPAYADASGGFYAYTRYFPEYTGKTIRVFQLQPGPNDWGIRYTNGIPGIAYNQGASPAAYGITDTRFVIYNYTLLYIFVK
jgi:hypothetical protein